MALLDTRHKKKSFTLTTVLLSLLLILMFYIGLTYLEPPIENGITVNFGSMEFGMGNQQPKEKIRAQIADPEPVEEEEQAVQEEAAPEPEEEVVNETTEKPAEKVLTQESEESIRLKQQAEAKRRADEAARKARAEEERKERERKAAEERARREQEAKKKKLDDLMGGLNKSDGTASGSEGNDDIPGDKGREGGDPYATSYYGTPGSGSGGGYGLNGRSLVSRGKVKQECNEEGRVVVRIVVDRSGKVVNATPGVKGTTNNHPCLLTPAKQTAFLHKWNFDNEAPSQQVGFVVVNFKLGE